MEFSGNKEAKKNKTLVIVGLALAVILIALFTNGFGLLGFVITPPNNTPLEINSSPVLGNPNAPVTIYEFSDFSCPFCAAVEGYNEQALDYLISNDPSWEAPIPEIKDTYVKSGKVKIVFKYYPGHGAGQAAQLVAWSLNDQGLFWQFAEKAFANQQDTGNIDKMKAIAMELGANMIQLNADLESNKYQYKFKEDADMGAANNIKGTPTFIINGQIIEGAYSASYFNQVIDEQLAKAKKA